MQAVRSLCRASARTRGTGRPRGTSLASRFVYRRFTIGVKNAIFGAHLNLDFAPVLIVPVARVQGRQSLETMLEAEFETDAAVSRSPHHRSTQLQLG